MKQFTEALWIFKPGSSAPTRFRARLVANVIPSSIFRFRGFMAIDAGNACSADAPESRSGVKDVDASITGHRWMSNCHRDKSAGRGSSERTDGDMKHV